MNYFSIKNNFHYINDNIYNDEFNIKIYYIDKNKCNILINRLDSQDGWGLELKIKLFDIYNDYEFEIINFGNSEKNAKELIYETVINLEYENIELSKIPSFILPRNICLLKNKYDFIIDNKNIEIIDIHYVLYYINDNKLKIIIRRLDEEVGMNCNNKITIILYDLYRKNVKEYIHLEHDRDLNNNNCIIIERDTKIKLYPEEHCYEQDIPKIIFQTGSNIHFKNILHYNSIMSFIDLNPEYTYYYLNDKESRRFLRYNFSDEINNSYDVLVPGAFKADLLRYCLLYLIGGCYFDCKQILKIPIRKFLDKDKTLIVCNDVIENALLNAVIFSNKKNSVIEQTIKDCVYNIDNKIGKTPLEVTGPIFFYKSIKHLINSDNLLLQNYRPPNDFNDFTTDYKNNNIKLIHNGLVILNRFYKNYYNNYLETNHYGKLFNNNEVYYQNIVCLDSGFKILVYPNYNEKCNENCNEKYNENSHIFNINIKIETKELVIINNKKNGWNHDLKILIINEKNFDEYFITVEKSDSYIKKIYLSFI